MLYRMYKGKYVTAWTNNFFTVKWWRHATCFSLTITMQISCFVFTVILQVHVFVIAGVLHYIMSGESGLTREYPTALFISQWPYYA